MPKKKEKSKVVISISGVIGWEVIPKDIRDALDEAGDADIEVQISSPGGYVFDGLEIYNLLRNYKGYVTTRLMGLAASMASYIAMVGDFVIAEDNSVFMLHNVSGLALGDHKTMRKTANIIEGLRNMLAEKYAEKSGQSLTEVKELMDDTTFLFGDEILKAGFVDEVAKTKKTKDKGSAVASAALVVAECEEKMKVEGKVNEDLEKAAAFLDINVENTVNGGDKGKQSKQKTQKTYVCSECGHQETHEAGKLPNSCPNCGNGSSDNKHMEERVMKLKEILAIKDADGQKIAFEAYFGESFGEDQIKDLVEALMKKGTTKIVNTVADDKLTTKIAELQASVEVLTGQVAEGKTSLEKEQAARRILEIKNSLKDVAVVGDLGKISKMVHSLEKIDPKLSEELEVLFKAASTRLNAAGIFVESGAVGEGKDDSPDSAYEKMKAKVDALLGDESKPTSPAAAWKKVIKENAELYAEYLNPPK